MGRQGSALPLLLLLAGFLGKLLDIMLQAPVMAPVLVAPWASSWKFSQA